MGDLSVGLALILVVGMFAQWLSWRFDLPAILFLLGAGLLVGPLAEMWFPTGRLLAPDELFGEGLFPIVSLAVGIILFEGALTLEFREIKGLGRYVRNMIFLGSVVTWGLAAWGAHMILGFAWELAVLFGAVLIVTGPTVIMPLLRQVRLKGNAGKILRWEGILNDPLGAILAVLVFEAIRFREADGAALEVLAGLGSVALASTVVGGLMALLLVGAFRWHLVPDYLQSPVTLGFVVAGFVISEQFYHESGLLTTTLMGLILANQRSLVLKHIQEFKENLSVLIISALFIVLAARVTPQDLGSMDLGSILFVIFLILVVRPAAALASWIGTQRTWQEVVMVSWMAPRGIVAVAICSIFSIELARAEFPDAGRLLAEMLFVILGTVIVYGLSARPLAQFLKLTNVNPRGVLLVGAHDWSRELAKAIQDAGGKVHLTDTNRYHVDMAREDGLVAFTGNIAQEQFYEELDLTEIGRVIALTPNDEVNSLTCVNFQEHLDRSRIFQLVPHPVASGVKNKSRRASGGRFVFNEKATFDFLDRSLAQPDPIHVFTITEEFTWEDFQASEQENWMPLFEVTEGGRTLVETSESNSEPKLGSKVVCLRRMKPEAEQ